MQPSAEHLLTVEPISIYAINKAMLGTIYRLYSKIYEHNQPVILTQMSRENRGNQLYIELFIAHV